MEGAKDYLDEHQGEHFSILKLPNGGIIATPNSKNVQGVNDMETDKPIGNGTMYFATHAEYIERLRNMGLYGPVADPLDEEMKMREQIMKEVGDKEVKKEERAVRHNEGKPRWALLPYEQLEEVVRVLEYGSKEYGDFNWQKPMNVTEIWESAHRHMVELHKGNLLDKGTGRAHAAHIITNMLFYLYHTKEK